MAPRLRFFPRNLLRARKPVTKATFAAGSLSLAYYNYTRAECQELPPDQIWQKLPTEYGGDKLALLYRDIKVPKDAVEADNSSNTTKHSKK